MVEKGSLNRLILLGNFINCDSLSGHSISKAQTTKVQQPRPCLLIPFVKLNYFAKKKKQENIRFWCAARMEKALRAIITSWWQDIPHNDWLHFEFRQNIYYDLSKVIKTIKVLQDARAAINNEQTKFTYNTVVHIWHQFFWFDMYVNLLSPPTKRVSLALCRSFARENVCAFKKSICLRGEPDEVENFRV